MGKWRHDEGQRNLLGFFSVGILACSLFNRNVSCRSASGDSIEMLQADIGRRDWEAVLFHFREETGYTINQE
jgi:hypothetical protein